MIHTEKSKKSKKSAPACNCETCEFYIYDEDRDEYVCDSRLDMDEAENFLNRKTQSCPYYRYYDEYKSVQKQN